MTKARHRQANGAVAVSYAYDSWGNPVSDATSASLSNRFTWQGREYSHATALYSFRARWYDPAAGCWLSKNPIGLEGGLNLYEAFGNNPVCFRDPRGCDRYCYYTNLHWEAAVDTWKEEAKAWKKTGTIRFGFQWNPNPYAKGGLITEYHIPDQEMKESCQYSWIPSTPEQDLEMLNMIRMDQKKPFVYFWGFQDCEWWASRALKYGKEDYR